MFLDFNTGINFYVKPLKMIARLTGEICPCIHMLKVKLLTDHHGFYPLLNAGKPPGLSIWWLISF